MTNRVLISNFKRLLWLYNSNLFLQVEGKGVSASQRHKKVMNILSVLLLTISIVVFGASLNTNGFQTRLNLPSFQHHF